VDGIIMGFMTSVPKMIASTANSLENGVE